MNIERFINRLRYAFYIVEKIEYRAYRRVISTEVGFLTGIECNLLSIIGFKKMLSLGVIPISAIVITAYLLELLILYKINKKNLTDELFKKYIPIFEEESFISKTIWHISAMALLVISFVYFIVSIMLFFLS